MKKGDWAVTRGPYHESAVRIVAVVRPGLFKVESAESDPLGNWRIVEEECAESDLVLIERTAKNGAVKVTG